MTETNMPGNDRCHYRIIISFDIYNLALLYVLYKMIENK